MGGNCRSDLGQLSLPYQTELEDCRWRERHVHGHGCTVPYLLRLHGSENLCAPSRFLREIPAEYLREVRPRTGVSQPVFRPGALGRAEQSAAGLSLGQRVGHRKFGEGTVLAFEGDGARARIQVNFDEAGSKWLIAGYAKLDPL